MIYHPVFIYSDYEEEIEYLALLYIKNNSILWHSNYPYIQLNNKDVYIEDFIDTMQNHENNFWLNGDIVEKECSLPEAQRELIEIIFVRS